ncbi:hypothetical protein CI102_13115 [Trichoderma harzianum]|nr:hypothetical protein CI102_13115 [Trichoderma harzianum]
MSCSTTLKAVLALCNLWPKIQGTNCLLLISSKVLITLHVLRTPYSNSRSVYRSNAEECPVIAYQRCTLACLPIYTQSPHALTWPKSYNISNKIGAYISYL